MSESVRGEAIDRAAKALGERWPFALWGRLRQVAAIAIDESRVLDVLESFEDELAHWQRRGQETDALVDDLVAALKWQTNPARLLKGTHRDLFKRAEALRERPGAE